MILAISQHAVLDFFDEEPIAVNDRGYIEVDPLTFETSVPGVYAGGDVVNDQFFWGHGQSDRVH